MPLSLHMDAFKYINILETVLLCSVQKIYSEKDILAFRLVQDNSAVHSARIVKEMVHSTSGN